jgi:hypothetical protein
MPEFLDKLLVEHELQSVRKRYLLSAGEEDRWPAGICEG